MTIRCAGASWNKSFGKLLTAAIGRAITTISVFCTASATVAGRAPVSRAKSASEAGPRELATTTSCPAFVNRRKRSADIAGSNDPNPSHDVMPFARPGAHRQRPHILWSLQNKQWRYAADNDGF